MAARSRSNGSSIGYTYGGTRRYVSNIEAGLTVGFGKMVDGLHVCRC